jgi:sarcosine oxidase, subunit alpha
MPERLRIAPPEHPLTFSFDSEELVGESGDTVATALHGAGFLGLSRSPKFHRPRGAACHRGGCEGCLVRIDGVPNQAACLIELRPGMRVETQNTFGTRDLDLLRVTDWVFPHGINHHEFMAGIPGVQDAMQAIARRITGLGTMPDKAEAARPARRRETDVLVIGSGAAAQAIAARLSASGRTVELADDAPAIGGSLRFMTSGLRSKFAAIEATFSRAHCTVMPRTTAGAIFDSDVLLVGPQGAELVCARTLVFAMGAHDTIGPFPGNDIPGVMSARAASLLATRRVRPGKQALVVVTPNAGPFGEALAQEAGLRLVHGEVVSARGTSRVEHAQVRLLAGESQSVEVDALIVDSPTAPAYELAVQAGARVVHAARGFIVQTEDGCIRHGVYAVGEMVGTALEPKAIEAEADKVLERISTDAS